ncbi:hypothetical protein Mlab_1528 [Methanocorpusculum labreanum Z]|uniref:HTH cro/C1-type domain-containing protein n=1 Tax=Methanocorpusculum labreanum (strain ATCC 43576 / DSM 4855 / Z) TaxID=410358 RepID=A2STN6_METLZ|nr:winged helix-turn-helix domain-containing protein [Methanocorpusculum labreanum]ABN07692.1 hypothetical protein Mlab_1528 [Methanocorpusculum labreanum Z]
MDTNTVNVPSPRNSKESGLNMIMFHLRNSKFGLSISDIAKKTGLNRNTISRYLTILATLGQVEIRTVGPSHVYQLSERLPISPQFLAVQPEPTIVVNNEGIILALNSYMRESLGNTLGIDTENLVGKNYKELNSELFNIITALPEYVNALNGKMPTVGAWTYLETSAARCRLWILPIIFFDGIPGIMIQAETWICPEGRK